MEGTHFGSTSLTFTPHTIQAGKFHFAVGAAGSATLVLLTILPALMTAKEPSHITLEGGTHNQAAPPFDFLVKSFLPLIARMGPQVEVRLEKFGFYPAGGGRMVAEITPLRELTPLTLEERGHVSKPRVHAIVANLDRKIAQREIDVIATLLGCGMEQLQISETKNSAGPGNVAMVEVESHALIAVFTAFGRMGVSDERVGADVAEQVRTYLGSEAAVCEHLADQLLLPMALAGAGSFTTGKLSSHAHTNMTVIREFLPVSFAIENDGNSVTIAVAK